jgi:hypothetical protein
MYAVFSDGILSGFVWELVTELYVGLNLQADLLNPLFSEHFRQLRGSPSLVRWLTEWPERRLQTIVC